MRVVVADTQMLTREGIARLLADWGIEVVGTADDLDGLLHLVDRQQPDVVISELRMPPTHTDEGVVGARRIRREHPGVGILILSQEMEPGYATWLMEEHPGGAGYLLKDRVHDVVLLIDALRRISDGESVIDPTIVARLSRRERDGDALGDLTARELEVLGLMADGLSNVGIAGRLCVAERTVEAHMTRVYQKLDLDADPERHRRILAVLAYLER